MVGFDDDGRDKSEFNMAVAFLNRLNYLLYSCNEASMNLDAYAWFTTLLRIRMELIDDMQPEEKKEANKHIDSLAQKVMNQSKVMNKTGRNDIPWDLYREIDNFEIFLREVCKKAGYKSRFQDEAGKALR